MKSLVVSIKESLNINEAKALTFTNDIEGVESFCKYVFDPEFNKWTVNPDKTITVTNTPAHDRELFACIHTKDLTEMPNFIKFSNMENYGLELSFDSKIKNFDLNVNGDIKRLAFDKVKKLETLNLSGCTINNPTDRGLIIEGCAKLKSVVGPKSDVTGVSIRKNVNLESLNLGGIKKLIRSYIDKNKNLALAKTTLPKEHEHLIEIEGKTIPPTK